MTPKDYAAICFLVASALLIAGTIINWKFVP